MSINVNQLFKSLQMLYIKSKEIQLWLEPREMVILGLTEMQETIKNTMISLL